MVFFPSNRPLVIAHRGFAASSPENTLPAFQAALDLGADILETDVHLSRDGEVVVAHDPVLDRVAGRSGSIRDFTAGELQSIDLGGGVGMPTLAQVLEAFPHARFNIDLKTPEVVDPFIQTIRALDAVERVLVASFDENSRKRAVRELDGVATSATRPHVFRGLAWSTLGARRAFRRALDGIHAFQLPMSVAGVSLVGERFIRHATEAGMQFQVWTINDVNTMDRLWRRGVTGFITDRTDLAMEWRQSLAS